MLMTDRQIVFAQAVRKSGALIIGLPGASGAGKTLSALKIARGLVGGDDRKIGVIDTESGRALHYAPSGSEVPDADHFGFAHLDLEPPFTPEAYLGAIKEAERAGFGVVVVDSASHEWDGEGGMHDIQAALVNASVDRQRAEALGKGWKFSEAMARDKSSIPAWTEAKQTHHKPFIQRLLRLRCHLILCFRADEKMRIETVEEEGAGGKRYKKTVIIPAKDLPIEERWVPICERKMPYELTISLLLTPSRPGFPIPLKLQQQHRDAIPLDRPLGEETGRLLAAWAAGEASSGTVETPTASLRAQEAEAAARRGTAAFRDWWSTMPKSERDRLRDRLTEFQTLAITADAENSPQTERPETNEEN
jgi:hypothetical protein